MNQNHKELISIGLTIAIVLSALFIIHRYIPSITWAAIIAISTYPLYKKWLKLLGKRHNLAAFSFTLIISLLLFLPLSWLLTLLVKELQLFFTYIQKVNRDGEHVPQLIRDLPIFSQELTKFWEEKIGSPGGIKSYLVNLHTALAPASYYVKQIGLNLAHRSVQVGFTFLTLFFFYRDGESLFKQINHIGETCLGKRWFRYSDRLPTALRATVNGTIFVGVGVGILMGVCYAFVNLPGPTLAGFITALAAMIPFAVPFVFGVIALILLGQGSLIGALIVIIWGTIVMFVADHFVKPVLIGGAIRLPFMAVLFGILGGLETLGLLGLFVGPIIMVLFITLWYESQGFGDLNKHYTY